jgi:hypothetical protein
MNLLSILFWGLVLVTAFVSLRWGAMIGLIAFVLALLLGAVAISRFSADGGVSTAHGFGRAAVVDEARGAEMRAIAPQPRGPMLLLIRPARRATARASSPTTP